MRFQLSAYRLSSSISFVRSSNLLTYLSPEIDPIKVETTSGNLIKPARLHFAPMDHDPAASCKATTSAMSMSPPLAGLSERNHTRINGGLCSGARVRFRPSGQQACSTIISQQRAASMCMHVHKSASSSCHVSCCWPDDVRSR